MYKRCKNSNIFCCYWNYSLHHFWLLPLPPFLSSITPALTMFKRNSSKPRATSRNEWWMTTNPQIQKHIWKTHKTKTIHKETMNPTDYIFAACGTLLALIVLLRKENGHARQSTKRITHERAPRDPTITVSEQARFCQLCYDQRYLSLYVWTQ